MSQSEEISCAKLTLPLNTLEGADNSREVPHADIIRSL